MYLCSTTLSLGKSLPFSAVTCDKIVSGWTNSMLQVQANCWFTYPQEDIIRFVKPTCKHVGCVRWFSVNQTATGISRDGTTLLCFLFDF